MYLEKSLASLEEKIDAPLQPYWEERERLQTLPDVSQTTAAALIAEIGGDREPFPTGDI